MHKSMSLVHVAGEGTLKNAFESDSKFYMKCHCGHQFYSYMLYRCESV